MATRTDNWKKIGVIVSVAGMFVTTLVLVAGWSGRFTRVETNVEGLKQADSKQGEQIKAHDEKIHMIEINQAEDMALKRAILDSLGEIKTVQSDQGKGIQAMKEDMREVKVKFDNLERAE